MEKKIAALIKWAMGDQKLNRFGSPAYMKREGYIEALRDIQKILVPSKQSTANIIAELPTPDGDYNSHNQSEGSLEANVYKGERTPEGSVKTETFGKTRKYTNKDRWRHTKHFVETHDYSESNLQYLKDWLDGFVPPGVRSNPTPTEEE